MLNPGALSNLKVLDLSRMMPGPYCSMILADHGAQVIAVEDRRYEAEGSFVRNLYRNKRHMTLDLKTGPGKKILCKLAESADVFIEGFRPGVVKNLGIDYDTLSRMNSGLVYCSITGYGQDGPHKAKAGHDVNYLSYAGVLDQIGVPGLPPVIPNFPIADIAAGALNAVIGILMALNAKQMTGKGQHIDISMTDGSLGLLQLTMFFRDLYGETPTRGQGFISHRYACYTTYETRDGRYLSIGAVENRFWKVLCEHLGMAEYIPLQYEEARKDEIIDTFREVFKTKTLDEWDRELSGLDVCYAPVRTLDEVLEDPFFESRQMVAAPQGEQGANFDSYQIGIPIKMKGTPGSLRTPPVRFGENTGEVLSDLGYSKGEIERLKKSGVI